MKGFFAHFFSARGIGFAGVALLGTLVFVDFFLLACRYIPDHEAFFGVILIFVIGPSLISSLGGATLGSAGPGFLGRFLRAWGMSFVLGTILGIWTFFIRYLPLASHGEGGGFTTADYDAFLISLLAGGISGLLGGLVQKWKLE